MEKSVSPNRNDVSRSGGFNHREGMNGPFTEVHTGLKGQVGIVRHPRTSNSEKPLLPLGLTEQREETLKKG